MPPQSIIVRGRDRSTRVGWVLDGQPLLDMEWDVALAVCDALRIQVRAARAFAEAGVRQVHPEVKIRAGATELAVRQEGNTVLFIGRGRLLFSQIWQVAEQLWLATVGKARLAEEWAKAEGIVADAALLFRTGAPIGFTDHPVLQDEMVKHAVHDRTLRRALPGGVKSTVILGAPVVILGTIPPDQKLRKLVRGASPAQRQAVIATLSAAR